MYMTMMHNISRREFIKISALGVLGTLLPSIPTRAADEAPSYGRVMDDAILAYSEPYFESRTASVLSRDQVLPIQDVVLGDGLPYNQAWFRVEQGYIHSTKLQPVEDQPNQPVKELGARSVLAEMTVPFCDAYRRPSLYGDIAYRYYYGSTHWIDLITHDSSGQTWYRVSDDLRQNVYTFVLAENLRMIPKEELQPLSIEVPEHKKRIEVRMLEQMLIAYEDEQPVLITQCSTGDHFTNPRWVTPTGGYQTFYKRPSRHMAAGNLAFGDFDLPGVPWVCYMTIFGIAIHGTYWHNDFGRPRSHGCVNLLPQDAKWIYRWTLPSVPPHNHLKYQWGHGTRVDIF